VNTGARNPETGRATGGGLPAVERWLLFAVLPLYLLAVALHADRVADTGLAQLPVFAVGGWDDRYPVVGGFRLETDSSGSELEVGDRLIALGGADLRGQGQIGFRALGLAMARPGEPVPLVFERDGERRTVPLEPRPHEQPWSRMPLLLLVPLVCGLVLLRAPGSPGARRFFVAFTAYAVAQAQFYGGPVWQSWIAGVFWELAAPASLLLMLHWARRFPDEMPEEDRPWRGWPWVMAGLYVLVIRVSYFTGFPVPTHQVPALSMAAHGLSLAFGLVLLGWNYVHARPVGRRRLRWILLGTSLGSLPVIAAHLMPMLAPSLGGFESAYAVSFLFAALWMTGIVLAVTRDNAFDVDRLLGATAAWAVTVAGGVALLAVALPSLAESLSRLLGLDAAVARIVLAATLGGLVLPAGRRLRPRMDRLFFPERVALQEGSARLVEELDACSHPGELLELFATRTSQLLRSRGSALYVRAGDGTGWLRRDEGSLCVPSRLPADLPWPRRIAQRDLPAPLAEGGAALLVPLYRGSSPEALVCLGRKRSEDVYTTTDVGHLAAAAARLEARWLRSDKEAADRESRAKTDLLAAASHDLRQPLHAMALLADALAERVGEGEAREMARRLASSTHGLDEMLNALLDRARLDAGALEPEPGPVDLGGLFARLAQDFGPEAETRGLRLRVVPSRLCVHSDRVLLLRILRNLVSNALRYTPSGAVMVLARRRGGRVRIEVRDSGPGIPEAARRCVFEAFRQLPGSRNGGLGLGLSIVDGLARLLGHEIELHSQPGRGSLFAVWLEAAAEGPARAPDPLPAAAAATRGRRVLVLDDDDAVREATAALLRGWGCEVHTAGSLEDALHRVRGAERTPELLLVDLHLGGGRSGTEAVATLRSAAGDKLPAAIVTAETSPATLDAVRAAGLPVLRKPVRAPRLRALVAALESPGPGGSGA